MTGLRAIAIATGIAIGAALPAAPAAASAGTDFVDGEVIVRFKGAPERVLELPAGASVKLAARALESNPKVAYATPNHIARASGIANDPGGTGRAGGWRYRQWNFLACGSTCGEKKRRHQARGGIDAVSAWKILYRRGRAFGRGAKVAVLDTGVAFATRKPRFRRSPDFARGQFRNPWDFVQRDRWPLDLDGHGTHVTGTIAERTGNGVALTGLAPRAKIVPVRVLDANGFGTARDIARGIRYAAKKGARVINMSFEFSSAVRSCAPIRGVCKAIRYAARRHRALVVAAAGNSNGDGVAYPSAAPFVVSVGRTTKDACVADGSRGGAGLDLVAPGGGIPRSPACIADGTRFSRGAPILQLTFRGGSIKRFGYPKFYEGTSMAAAHVSGVAALVVASGVLGPRPHPRRVECQLEKTARRDVGELGEPYDRRFFGAGLLDARAAVWRPAAGC